MDERAIFFSKHKVSVLIAGALVFVAIGCWMLFQDSEAAKSMPPGLRNATAMRTVAALCITFFSLAAGIGVRKFFDRRPALVFNAAGLVNNSSAFGGKNLAWSDIRGIREVRVHRQRMLALDFADPETIVSGLNPAKGALYRMNIQLIGTPIAISASMLDIGFSELEDICLDYWRKYR